MFLRLLCLFFLLLLFFGVSGQVTGKVREADSNEPLSNVSVSSGNSLTFTSEDGFFQINPSADTLYFSVMGYFPDTLTGSELKDSVVVCLVPRYTQLEQIMVSSGMSEHKLLQMPSGVSLLTKKEMAASSGISYVEKLNQLPGVFVHQGALNTSRITIRGVGSRSPYATNRIKAYFNEIPLTNGDGTIEIEDINASIIHHIEVIKGSKSALYGSGLGGAVIITGNKPVKEGWHGSVALEAGSLKTVKPEIALYYNNNQWAVTTAYAHTQSAGWRQNSEYKRHNLNVLASHRGKKSNTDLLIQVISAKAFIPSSLKESTFKQSPDSAASNWLSVQGFEEYQKGLFGVKHEKRWGASFTSTSVLYLSLKNSRESRPFNILSDDSKGIGFRNILKMVHGNFDFHAGFEFLYDTYGWSIFETLSGYQGPMLNEFTEHRIPMNLFLENGYRFKNGALIEAGVSGNFLTYSLTDLSNLSVDLSGKYAYKPVLSPYLAMNIPVKMQWFLYSSVSHGFSAPSVEETLMPDGKINPALKPETGWNFESGARMHTPGGHFFMDMNLYLLLIDNLLVTERLSESVFYGRNAGKSQHSGVEFSSIVRLNRDQRFHLPQLTAQVSYNYSNPVFTQFVNNNISYTGNSLPGIPQHHVWTSALLEYRAGWFLSTQFQYTGSQYLNDANSDQYSPYSLCHIKIGYRSDTLKTYTYSISGGIMNIFDRAYASMLLINAPSPGGTEPRYYYPGEPRNYYVTVSLGF
jgi:iron complex outermembrane recepter protein